MNNYSDSGARLPPSTDSFVRLGKNLLSNPILLVSALGVTRNKRRVHFDEEYNSDKLGINIGLKYSDPDNPARGGKADIQIKDFSKLIPNSVFGLVKLTVSFKKEESHEKNVFDLKVEYELHHTHVEYGTIALVSSNNGNDKTLRFSVVSTKHEGRRFIRPFEVKLNSTWRDEMEGTFTYGHPAGVEFPIYARNDEKVTQLVLETPQKTTVFEYKLNWETLDLNLNLDLYKLGYEYLADLTLENHSEEAVVKGFVRISNIEYASFKLEIDTVLSSFYLTRTLGNRNTKVYKCQFRDIPPLLLKEFETMGFEVLSDFGPIPTIIRLAIKSQNVSKFTERDEIEIYAAYREVLGLESNNRAKELRITFRRDKLARLSNELARLSNGLIGQSESVHVFAELDGDTIFETRSDLIQSDEYICKEESGKCEITYKITVGSAIPELNRFLPYTQFALDSRVNLVKDNIKNVFFELKTNKYGNEYQILQIELEDNKDKYKLKGAWNKEREFIYIDIEIYQNLEKMELVYTYLLDPDRYSGETVRLDGRIKPGSDYGISKYELRYFERNTLVGTGLLTDTDEEMELIWLDESGKNFNDYKILFSQNQNGEVYNIKVDASALPNTTKPGCTLFIWNSSLTFYEDYEEPSVTLVSELLLDSRLFKNRCQEASIFESSTLSFNIKSNKDDTPFQLSLDTELKSDILPSGSIKLIKV